jgi:hypothetical protein
MTIDFVTPAQAGARPAPEKCRKAARSFVDWIPACAGMTVVENF